MYFEKQRIPFPHISASNPSLLNILILMSAIVESFTKIKPSAPIEKCDSHNLRAKTDFFSSGIRHLLSLIII